MDDPLFALSPCSIAGLRYPEIDEYIREGAALLVPLSTTEPYGDMAPLGCSGLVCQAIVRHVAERTGSLCAPPLAYGCAGGLRAFPGTAAVKPRVLANFLIQLLRGWHAQGLRRVCVVDGGWNNGAAVECALSRVAHFDGFQGFSFSWVRDSRIRSYWAHAVGRSDTARAEHATLSMAAFLAPSLVRPSKETTGRQAAEQQWPRWRRRGQDPELFRKLYPSAMVSSDAVTPDRGLGERLFAHIVETLVSDIERG